MTWDWLEAWWLWGAGALLLGGGFWLKRRLRMLRRMDRDDAARLRQLQTRRETTADPAERRALELVIGQVAGLQSRWFLDASDLNVWSHSRALVGQVAAAYHPEAPEPAACARIGPLLHAFLDLKQALVSLTQLPGFAPLARFRLRHFAALKAAWRKKQQWEGSAPGRALARLHFWFIAKWAYAVARSGDALFWAVKSGGFVFYDVVLKRLLVRWYLALGEAALTVYRDRAAAPDLPEDEVLEDLEDLPEPTPPPDDLPPAVRALADRSRQALLYHARPLPFRGIRENYAALVKDIAAFHHPESCDPLQEAALYDLVLSLARLCEWFAALEQKPVINKMLSLRLSHLMKVKAAADVVLESEWFDFLKKYKVGLALKYSTLAYRAFKKGSPGVVFKDVAYTVAREGGKRWLALTLHGKLAREANSVYQPSGSSR